MPSGSSGSSRSPRSLRSWPFALSTPRVSFSTLFYLSLVFASSILAQDVQLRPSAASDSFPACGLTCADLTKADDACTPPTAAVTDRNTYVSCFCQSSLLTNFKANTNAACTETCTSADDRGTLQKWYTNFCNNGGNTDSSTSSSSNNDNSSATSTSTSSAAKNNSGPRSWVDDHYQWIIMIVILAVGFTSIAFIGMWLKRRHDRKHPNLYHAAPGASDSRVFQARNNDPIAPGLIPPIAGARRHDSANTVSVAGSSRTDVAPPSSRQAAAPSKLQKMQAIPDTEIREAPR
ncbi:hypothetical protein BJX76DRAFT_75763 [Aspergillus varians]